MTSEAMEAVADFARELNSILENKPPVSKAKMTAVTKAAARAVRMYKHVVQAVEKFIQKCPSQYKIPGLYVIDSIVRSSRHQFGAERDVYGPRFCRNFITTFNNLFNTCPTDDKAKIVRVLNLWQRNNVFDAATIQPLLDIANPTSGSTIRPNEFDSVPVTNLSIPPVTSTPDVSATLQKLMAQMKGSSMDAVGPNLDRNKPANEEYDSEDDEIDDRSGPSQKEDFSLMIAKKLFKDQDLMAKLRESLQQKQSQTGTIAMNTSQPVAPSLSDSIDRLIDRATNNTLLPSNSNIESHSRFSTQYPIQYSHEQTNVANEPTFSSVYSQQHQTSQDYGGYTGYNATTGGMDADYRKIPPVPETYSRDGARRSRSRSPHGRGGNDSSRSPGRRRSRFDPQYSNFGHRTSPPVDPVREKERQRRQQGLPPVKSDTLTICSTTLWLGHLHKSTDTSEIQDHFDSFGKVLSLDHIAPRGCAYICMENRKDAYQAYSDSKNLRLHNNTVKVAWAPGKGMKSKNDLKDCWDVDVGAHYIPWERLPQKYSELEEMEEGGLIDDETLPPRFEEDHKSKRILSEAIDPDELSITGVVSSAPSMPPQLPGISAPLLPSSNFNQTAQLNDSIMNDMNIPPPQMNIQHVSNMISYPSGLQSSAALLPSVSGPSPFFPPPNIPTSILPPPGGWLPDRTAGSQNLNIPNGSFFPHPPPSQPPFGGPMLFDQPQQSHLLPAPHPPMNRPLRPDMVPGSHRGSGFDDFRGGRGGGRGHRGGFPSRQNDISRGGQQNQNRGKNWQNNNFRGHRGGDGRRDNNRRNDRESNRSDAENGKHKERSRPSRWSQSENQASNSLIDDESDSGFFVPPVEEPSVPQTDTLLKTE